VKLAGRVRTEIADCVTKMPFLMGANQSSSSTSALSTS